MTFAARAAQAAVVSQRDCRYYLILNNTSAFSADSRFLFILLVGYAGVLSISEIFKS